MAKIKTKYSGGMVEKQTSVGRMVNLLVYLAAILAIFICLAPIWHVVTASFSNGQKLFAGEGLHAGLAALPIGPAHLEGYEHLFEQLDNILAGFGNTIIYVVCSTTIGMVINICGAYVLSRKSKLRPILMIFVMFTVMFNGGLVPTYKVINALGWVNTRWALIIPGCTNAYFVIMLSNFFASVPEETIESAKIDGAGHFRIMWQIVLPQAASFTSVIVLNSVVLQWNSWINASIYLDSRSLDLYPLQLWLREWCADSENFLANAAGSLFGPDYNGEYLLQFTAIVISIVPVLLTFPLFLKKMEQGQLQGAVKG